MCVTYCSPSQNDNYFFDNFDNGLDVYFIHEKFVLARDFNAQVDETLLDTFLYQHKRTSMCYKNPNNSSGIDHILTNSSKSVFKTESVFRGFSDFPKLVLSVFNLLFSNVKAKEFCTGIARTSMRIILT